MTDDFLVGQKAGDYEVLGVLGAGGMGKVYKVRNVISDRVEAMKVVLANPASQKELADRFQREIKVLASLNHPNIAALRTALTIDNRLVMIMEYVEGETLALRLGKGPIPAPDAVNYVSQILSALSYAHGLGVIHRDIKPANMILTPAGAVKLMDFGIARPSNDTSMTMTGTALGSLNYMSPEQVKSEPVDPRSDLYSLGVSLYEMVTGQLPFRGHSNYSVMSAHLEDAPAAPMSVRPELPKGLNDIILMAMAKDPKSRFQSSEAFRNALKSVMPDAVPVAPGVVAAMPTPTPTRPLAATVPVSVVTPTPQPIPREAATIAKPAAAAAVAVAATPSPLVAPEYHVPPASGSQRGIYMALGGVLVLAMLAGAAIYLPRRSKTQANSPYSPPAPSSSTTTPAAPAATSTDSVVIGSDGIKITSSRGPAAANSPVDSSTATPAPAPAVPPNRAAPAAAAAPSAPVVPLVAPSAITGAASNSAANAAAKTAEQQAAADQQAEQTKQAALADEEKQTDQLNARAVSLSEGLDTMRHAQAAQGVGLRGDIATAEELMKTNLTRAQGAIDRGDPDKAKEYLDIAEAQAEKIEHFLGR